jgi:hypothetical protein
VHHTVVWLGFKDGLHRISFLPEDSTCLPESELT